jgi:hypothetical protein
MRLNLALGFKIFICCSLLLTSSCTNIFKSFSNQQTDSAIAFEIRKAINTTNYDSAITLLATLTADYRYSREGVLLAAAAYAGKCGLNFADFVEDLGSAAANPLLLQMMNLWNSKAVDYLSCISAQTEMERLAPSYLSRAADDAFFMVILGLVKLGTLLKETTDLDDDGVADDPPFNAGQPAFCNSTNFSDALTAEVGSGIGMVVANLTKVSSGLSGLDTTAIDAACTALAGTLGGVNPCLIEDRAVFLADAAKLKAIRTLLNTNSAGMINGAPCP